MKKFLIASNIVLLLACGLLYWQVQDAYRSCDRFRDNQNFWHEKSWALKKELQKYQHKPELKL